MRQIVLVVLFSVSFVGAFVLGMVTQFQPVGADHLGDEMHFVLGQQLLEELSNHTYSDGSPILYGADAMPEIKIYYWSHLDQNHQSHITNYAKQHGFDPEYHDEPHAYRIP